MSQLLMELLQKHRISPQSVLHIGGHRAHEVEIYQKYGITSGVFIEAQENLYEEIEKQLRHRENWRSVHALLSDTDDEIVEFFLATNDGMSSSLLAPLGHLLEYPEIGFPSSITMNTTTLDSLRLGSFDLTVIDVQGAELKVLAAGMATVAPSKALWLEVNVGGLYEADASITEIVAFLDQYDFVLVFVDMRTHLWGDALFLARSAMHAFGS